MPVNHLQLPERITGKRLLAIAPDRADFGVVVGAEAIQPPVGALLHEVPRLRDLVAGDVRNRQHLGHADAGEMLERKPVGMRVHGAAAHQMPADLARDWIVHRLVDAQLVDARPSLKEEIVQQVEDQVGGGGNVVTAPRRSQTIGRQGSAAPHEEVARIPSVADCREWRRRHVMGCLV
jgi:hypothetical protein